MKLRIQAQYLQPGDIMGSGEEIVYVGLGAKTPSGKIDIALFSSKRGGRKACWNKHTMVNVERAAKSINQIELAEEARYKD